MRFASSSLLLLFGALAGCAADDASSTTITQAASIGPQVTPPACTPRPPINPQLCNPEEPAPPPPPINGTCTIELRVDEVGFARGQGWLEGRAEASTSFTATNQDTGDVVTGSYPAAGTIKMDVGATHIASVSLGTYVVLANDPNGLDVEVCARFTEKDDLSKDDVGVDCETIHLTCPQQSGDQSLAADLCKGGDCTKLKGRMNANVNIMTKDADRDCVENEDDYTPEPCDEALKGQLCHASLVNFSYTSDVTTDLVQSLGTDLTGAMTGYDRVVLLINDDRIGPFNLNPAALALADVKMDATEQNYFAALQDLTARGCDITVWNFSHGSPTWQTQPNLSVALSGGWITTEADDDPDPTPDITTEELLDDTDPANSGTPSVPVRAVYSTSCWHALWNQPWLTVGAKVVSGARVINFKPIDYEAFSAHWNAGQTYGFSLANEQTVAAENLAFGFIAAEGALPPWLCVGNTVLGLNPCAQAFFTDVDHMPAVDLNNNWIDGPDEAKYMIGSPLNSSVGVFYDATASGAVNMRRSSRKILAGDPTVTKFNPQTWP